MQRVQPVTLANSFGAKGSRHWLAIGFVILLHVALLYALASGLAVRFAEQLPNIIHVDVVTPPQAAQPALSPPPAPELVAPALPQIPVPQIRIAHPQPAPHAITAVAVPKPVVAPAKPVAAAPLVAAPVIAPTPARAIQSTHTIPPYPPIAVRLGQEGTVRLHIVLDEKGAIHNVSVAKSSGSAVLDQAAVDWVRHHWRYAPATRDGKPVASSILADVRFDLLSAR
ncbi:MAG: TonB family protein [Rhizomicrobium sp.]